VSSEFSSSSKSPKDALNSASSCQTGCCRLMKRLFAKAMLDLEKRSSTRTAMQKEIPTDLKETRTVLQFPRETCSVKFSLNREVRNPSIFSGILHSVPCVSLRCTLATANAWILPSSPLLPTKKAQIDPNSSNANVKMDYVCEIVRSTHQRIETFRSPQ
jgi:hypothetical protein